ncbi:MAG: ABC transporter permease [Caulobacteraceae bacterium]|nr:ABC transporter permease [Caulobacteraceae bacterium]
MTRRRAVDLIPPVALLASLLLAWEAGCRALRTPAYLVPPPSSVALELWRGGPDLAVSALHTLAMAGMAFALASVTGLGLAIGSGLSPALERALRPLAVAAQVTPVVAIAPLVVIWAGVDHPGRAIVALAAVVAFFPIFSGAVSGLAAADPDLERLFDLYGATRTQRLARLRLPSAVPFVLEGHKVAAGLAVIGAVVAEFVAGSGGAQGLAWRILEAGNRLQTARMFAALVVLAVMAAGLHSLLSIVERRLLATWRGR